MITVRNVLADGAEIDDLTGHVVKASENQELYQLIEQMEAGNV